MARAKIEHGVWTRRVPWQQRGEWRTDIFKTVLADPNLRDCCFVLTGGPTVTIPAAELKRILSGGPDHYDAKIWGPFNIDPVASTVNGRKVEMKVA